MHGFKYHQVDHHSSNHQQGANNEMSATEQDPQHQGADFKREKRSVFKIRRKMMDPPSGHHCMSPSCKWPFISCSCPTPLEMPTFHTPVAAQLRFQRHFYWVFQGPEKRHLSESEEYYSQFRTAERLGDLFPHPHVTRETWNKGVGT